MSDPDRARLRAELLALGRGIGVPGPEDDGLSMAERVLAQIVGEAVPVPVPVFPGRLEQGVAWARRRARTLTGRRPTDDRQVAVRDGDR
ncbi:hypothetical protein [Streptomyces sp. LN785]|uniref:hypothetical protein n=1 Tax=Streptomyces sp. LN785 TaxID=3112983 RepID=UPI0037160E74